MFLSLTKNVYIIIIYLLYCFQGPGWEYETELPDWARVDWTDVDQE